MSISSTRVERAHIRFVQAHESLRARVGCFWVLTVEPDAQMRLVPDGSSTLYVERFAGQDPTWWLRGPLREPHARRFSGTGHLVGIRLRPGTAGLLTGQKQHPFVDQRVPAGEVFAGARGPWDDRAPTPRPEDDIAVLEGWLRARLLHKVLPPVVTAALEEIERTRGAVTVEALAAHCHCSPRQLNRVLRTWLGYGAKRHANIVRCQATLHRLHEAPHEPAAGLAVDQGYYDQAHLSQDLARLAGDPPGRLHDDVSDFSKTLCDDLP